MVNKFCKVPLYECTRDLVDVALERKKADLVIINSKLINVCTKEIQENIDVAVVKGRIAKIGNCKNVIGDNTKVIDANGRYLAPAFMDAHMHIESSMMNVGEYAKAVIPHGTCGVFFDPHEICNVIGLNGVRYMLDDAKRTPLKAMLTTPSCVPAVPGFEDTGAEIHPKDIAETMLWDECVGLGEMMNFPGICNSDKHTHDIVAETLKAGKVVTGHFPIPDTGDMMDAYISAGIRCCHESTRGEDALEKMRMGMYAFFRDGSAWKDLRECAKAITVYHADSRFACLCTDDDHPHTLKSKGHLDHVIKKAIVEGISPIEAIQMVTINTATCFNLDHEIGSIAPSKCADICIIEDLTECKVNEVIIDGELVAKDGKMINEFKPYSYPSDALNTVHLNKMTEEDFKIKAEGKKAKCTVIEIIPNKTITNEIEEELDIVDGSIQANVEKDCMKAVVFERHKRTGTKGFGFIKGFGIKDGALAQTVAHDAHNLLVVGTNDKDMTVAANALIECGGGLVAVKDGKVIGLVELPIAGLLSLDSLDVTNAKVENIEKAWKEMGSHVSSPFMTMGIVPLACIPNIRLTNRGLVDCNTFKFVDLIKSTK